MKLRRKNLHQKNRHGSTTLCSRPFALESVSRRETAVQGQTAVTHVRCGAF
jgi:hypothetical protein